MNIIRNVPPRTFQVGASGEITITDCARIELEPDEQVTFVTSSGAEYDVVRKTWGFYAAPSLNDRVPRKGLRAAFASGGGKEFLFLVEESAQDQFLNYIAQQGLEVTRWF